MIRIVKNIFILLFINLVLPVFGQDVKEDLKKINLNYQNNNYSMDIEYILFKNYFTKEPFNREKGFVRKSGTKFNISIGQIEIVKTEDFYLTIDHDDKTISIFKNKHIAPTDPNYNEQDILINMMEKAISYCDKVEFIKINPDQNSYIIQFPEYSEFSKIEIVFDRQTYWADKLILYYRQLQNMSVDQNENEKQEKPRLEIIYSNINTNPAFHPETFTYNRFLRKENGKYISRDNYKNYQIINQYETF